MISKCSTVILNKRKFSEFEDGDLDDRSLYIVGYQDIDGERVNVKINVAELLDKKNGDQVFVVSELTNDSCVTPLIGPQGGIQWMECCDYFLFDIRETGTYIQINCIPDNVWKSHTDPATGKISEYYIDIAFTNTVLGNNIKLYLPNLGKSTTFGDEDAPCKVYIYQIGPDEMEQISNFKDGQCKLCDFGAGQKHTTVLTSYPKSVHAIEAGRLKRDYYDYFARFITLTDLRGIKMTRPVEVTNIYEGDWSEDGNDIG